MALPWCRYKDIVPFDHNRVRVLPPYKIAGDSVPRSHTALHSTGLTTDTLCSDYINASFICDQMAGSGRRYIAAQGPGPDTTAAMWQLIWQYEVSTGPVYSKKVAQIDSGTLV